jgi:tetratricopeptide (TPR) repeat protein
MRRGPKLARYAFVCAFASISALTHAQPSDNKALAEQLFTQGRDLAKANNWAAACPKFEASLKYDPTLGTRLNLATCYEKTGRLASAWGLYREAAELAAKAGDDKRKQYALTQASALEPRLPKLTIAAPATPPPGFAVTRDGSPVDAGAFGTSLYVDPGDHAIAASAAGYESFSTTITVKEGKSETITLPPLVKAKVVVNPNVTPTAEPVIVPSAPAPSHARKYAGIGLTAAGVVAAGVGLAFGAKASSTYKDAKALCGSDLVCDNDSDYAKGKKLVSDARSQATLSTVLVIAGGAAVATGVVLWITAPSGSHPERTAHVAPAVTTHSAGLVLEGSF